MARSDCFNWQSYTEQYIEISYITCAILQNHIFSYKCNFERFARPILLQSIGKSKGIIHLVVLKDVEAAIQGNFPAVISHDVAGVDRAGAVELPGEVHAHAACGLLHLLEVVFLLITPELIFHCY